MNPVNERRMYWANDEVSAGVVASYLRSEGFRARVVREDPSIFLWGRSAVGGFAVVVPEDLADEARRVLGDRAQQRSEGALPPLTQLAGIVLGVSAILVFAAWLAMSSARR